MSAYWCTIGKHGFNGEAHTDPETGEDCCAQHCPVCKRERRAKRADPPAQTSATEATP
jgi:hypothetical protein